jgi:hypothetical protein
MFVVPRTWPHNLLVDEIAMNAELRDQLIEVQARILALEAAQTDDSAAVAALLAPWTAYTPSLTAAITNPSVGAGSITGSYIQFGKTVIGVADIIFGAGMSVGNGAYSISLPKPPSGNVYTDIGEGWVYDFSTTTTWQVILRVTGVNMNMSRTAAGTAIYVSQAQPTTWAANDHIHTHFSYQST